MRCGKYLIEYNTYLSGCKTIFGWAAIVFVNGTAYRQGEAEFQICLEEALKTHLRVEGGGRGRSWCWSRKGSESLSGVEMRMNVDGVAAGISAYSLETRK